jgi:hypothetical protein
MKGGNHCEFFSVVSLSNFLSNFGLCPSAQAPDQPTILKSVLISPSPELRRKKPERERAKVLHGRRSPQPWPQDLAITRDLRRTDGPENPLTEEGWRRERNWDPTFFISRPPVAPDFEYGVSRPLLSTRAESSCRDRNRDSCTRSHRSGHPSRV